MDWQLTCRVCLETGEMVSFFDWDENNEQLCDKYTFCCGVEVPKNDTLPTLICLNCVDRLTIAYQFKQQCLSSNETLKECLDEFRKTSALVTANNSSKVTETETITIKQENGLLLQYELPVEHDPQSQWTRTISKSSGNAVVTKAPGPKKRGRPRKYPDEQGQISTSPYKWKKGRESVNEPEALTKLLASGAITLKEEPADIDDEPFANDEYEDPDFIPGEDGSDIDIKEEDAPRKRGRPRKSISEKPKKQSKIADDGEDVLLQETIMAYSEPIPDHILNPKPKAKKTGSQPKKKYVYDKTHVCETCGQSFTSNASLQGHIRRHLGIKPYVCSVCGYECVLSRELRRHMMRHTGARPYKCRVCDRHFRDFGSRQKHECVCGFATTFRLSLSRHMLRHTGQRPYGCRYCDRKFFEQGDRQKHESVCDYSCVMKEALRRHMLRHTGERPYKCRICERRFGDFGTRQKHERLHMGVRPYQCTLCGKSFTYSYVLGNHMLTHTGEKKYSCVPCNKKFTKAHHLKYHNKIHHKELYIEQQLEAETKKMAQQMRMTGISGAITGQIVDGSLQLVQVPEEETEQESQMQVVEEEEEHLDDPDKETDRAVAGMQGVIIDGVEGIVEEEEESKIDVAFDKL